MGGEHLVILIHGIRTRALWMDEVKPALEDAGFAVSATSYGQYGLVRFLMPGDWLRRKAIERVVTDIVTARRVSIQRAGREPETTSVIAHSFGTYVLMKIIAGHPEIRWNRVVLCGSVVRENFPLEQYLERFDAPILNEIGTRDYWPALAESIGWGYGSVGSTGFNRPPVESRWHKDFTHSQFLTRQFCLSQWVPFLRDGRIERGDAPRDLPLAIRLLTSFPLRLIVPLLSLALVALVVISTTLPFRHRGSPVLAPPDYDNVISAPERAPFASFSYASNGVTPQFTVPKRWTKMTDAGVTYWLARNEDGTNLTRFDILHRIDNDHCTGTVVYMQGSAENQILIPDQENGCQNHALQSRASGYVFWTDLGEVDFGK